MATLVVSKMGASSCWQGGHFVVLGLGGHAQLPQLFVQFLHESGDFGADDAEVMLFELLTLGRGSAEQGAAGQDQVLTCS